MEKKIFIGITVSLCFIAGVIGLIKRQTYTNITDPEFIEENFMNDLHVFPLNLSLFPDEMMDDMKGFLLESPYILRVKASGSTEFLFRVFQQPIEVLEVYRGSDIMIGDELTVFSSGWSLFIWDMLTMNAGFTNFMQEGDEYLIFLNGPVDNLENNPNVFELIPTIISPMFNFETREHYIPSGDLIPMYTDGIGVAWPFSDVSQNEFFVANQETLDSLIELKESLLELFPR